MHSLFLVSFSLNSTPSAPMSNWVAHSRPGSATMPSRDMNSETTSLPMGSSFNDVGVRRQPRTARRMFPSGELEHSDWSRFGDRFMPDGEEGDVVLGGVVADHGGHDLVFYTDGLVESRDRFLDDGMAMLLQSISIAAADAVCAQIM